VNQKEFITIDRKEHESLLGRLGHLESELKLLREREGQQNKQGVRLKTRRTFWRCFFERTIVVFVIFLFINSVTFGDPVWVKTGFLTGNQYLREPNKATYLMGVVDGFCGAQLLCDKHTFDKFQYYIAGKENFQIQAIVDKYLKENPRRWNESMNILIYCALFNLK
jgi:hypothetical protein